MDLKGSLIDTRLRIYPAKHFTAFLETLPDEEDIPANILKLIGRNCKGGLNDDIVNSSSAQLYDEEINKLQKIREFVQAKTNISNGNINEAGDVQIDDEKEKSGDTPEKQPGKMSLENNLAEEDSTEEDSTVEDSTEEDISETKDNIEQKVPEKEPIPFLTTADIDWLYSYIQKRKTEHNDVPYLHYLLEGANVETPDNKIIKRNPELEARCVKLRKQQEAREYRKMTKTVDNVRMRFPEDSISYQMKQLNRQLIAIAQFVISIFAGFLFGFRGIEWIVGNLDIGFRLLLGVMCALVIALAEIYFLAKKLNEELNIPEPLQLGGPHKFAEHPEYRHLPSKIPDKEHQD